MIEKNQKIYALYHNYRKSTDLIFILLSLDLSSFENTVDPDQLASHIVIHSDWKYMLTTGMPQAITRINVGEECST